MQDSAGTGNVNVGVALPEAFNAVLHPQAFHVDDRGPAMPVQALFIEFAEHHLFHRVGADGDFYDFFAVGKCVGGGFESFEVGVAYEDEEQNQGGDGDFQDGATHGGFWLLGNEYVSASYSNARRR